ncbi:MAG: helix-turn-helix transcriptional regulator [Oscillospiraceae bacterium]|nr:helix-turn-helix transcriptional regulator [Oscillospiraceae bacterium]
MNYNPVETGKRIKQIRQNMGLSQDAYSEKLHISRTHLAKVEVGLKSASIDLLIAISELSQVSTDYLLKGCTPDNSKVKEDIRTLIHSLTKLEQNL